MSNINLVIGGLITFVAGLILALLVVDTAATTGADAQMPSFASAKTINDILPTFFYIGLLVGGLGAMGVGTVRAIRG